MWMCMCDIYLNPLLVFTLQIIPFLFCGFDFYEFFVSFYFKCYLVKRICDLISWLPYLPLFFAFYFLSVYFTWEKKYRKKEKTFTNIKINRFHRKPFKSWRFFFFQNKSKRKCHTFIFEKCVQDHIKKSYISVWMNEAKLYLNWKCHNKNTRKRNEPFRFDSFILICRTQIEHIIRRCYSEYLPSIAKLFSFVFFFRCCAHSTIDEI